MEERVIALVPCKNGAATIVETVRALAAMPDVDGVVVVDDGSSDDTAGQARAAGARVIRHPKNLGKGAAITSGVEATPEASVYVLVDADTGGTAGGVAPLLKKVLNDEADLAVGKLPTAGGRGGFGVVKRGSSAVIKRACGLEVTAPLSGQRAIRASSLRRLVLAPRFGVEVAMTIDCVRNGDRVLEFDVDMDHAHTGRSLSGFAHRARQGMDVTRAAWPRLVPKLARTALGALALLGICAALLLVGRGDNNELRAVDVSQSVRVVMVPGLQWPEAGEEWFLPANVAAGSVVTGSDDPLLTAATGKSQPNPRDEARVEIEVVGAEEFVGSTALQAKPDEIVFVAGFAEPGMKRMERPLLLLGSGLAGELTSDSTKRPGLVDLRDLASVSIGGSPEGSTVRVDEAVYPEPADYGERAALTGFYDDNNPTFIGALVAFVVMVSGLALAARRFDVPLDVRNGVTAVAAVPLGAFGLRWWTGSSELSVVAWSALLAAIVGIIVVMAGRRARDAWAPLRRIAFFTAAFLVGDVLTGAHLQQSGLFGSSPSLGARYYGLGNPATTLLISSALVWSVLHLRNLPMPVSSRPVFLQAGVWLTVVLVVGLADLGADAGGLVVATASGLFVVALASGIRLTRRRILGAGAIATAGVVIAAIADATRGPGERTHLGNLAAEIGESGLAPLAQAVTDRVGANLFGYGFPASVAVPIVCAGALLWLFRGGEGVRWLTRGSFEWAGVVGCLSASLGLWALNDSGVVVLALSSLFVVPLVAASMAEADDAKLLEVKVQ